MNRIHLIITMLLLSLSLCLSTVQSVHFPAVKDSDLAVGAAVSVCFERGGKMVSSQEHAAVVVKKTAAAVQKTDRQDLVVEVGETLRLVATLYRTGSNAYQEKAGKLVVRQRASEDKPKGSNAHKGIGIAKLSLHTIAGSFEPSRLTLALTQCSAPGVVVNAMVSAKVLGDGEEDTMSQMSGMSDVSCDVADFGSDSFGAAATAGATTRATTGATTGAAGGYGSFGANGGSGAVSGSGMLAESALPLGGIAEETAHDLTGEPEGEPEGERPGEISERIVSTCDASKTAAGARGSSGPPNNVASALDSGPALLSKSSWSREEIDMDVPMDLTKSMHFDSDTSINGVSQAAYDDKVMEILKLRHQLDSYTADLSRMESKLSTSNMLVNAETKRSKKLKSELADAKKQNEDVTHTVQVLEKQKSQSDTKVKFLEGENDKMKLMLATQRHLTEEVSERQQGTQEVLKGVLDQKLDFVILEDQLNDITSDRDVYKTELEAARVELAYLRDGLASRRIGVPAPQERYEEDQSDVISALRSQLGSFQILAEEEKADLGRRLEAAGARAEKVRVHSVSRENQLSVASVQALALAKEGWQRERTNLETNLTSASGDAKQMVREIEDLRQKLQVSEMKLSNMEADRTPSPPPTRSSDGPAPMLRQLSKMKSIRASFTGSSKNLLGTTESEAEVNQRQIDSLSAAHQNEIVILSKELNALRTKVSMLESELDAADQRLEAINHELKLTKLELWETLDKVDTNANVAKPEKRESLRTSLGSMPAEEASATLLEQLISLKMDYATLANVRDSDRLETFALKRRAQGYAQLVANLEVQLALATDRERNKEQ
jgi:hypothetical protein